MGGGGAGGKKRVGGREGEGGRKGGRVGGDGGGGGEGGGGREREVSGVDLSLCLQPFQLQQQQWFCHLTKREEQLLVVIEKERQPEEKGCK